MLEYFLTVDKQIISMLCMVAVGYILFRVKLISEKGLHDMSQLLLKIITPMILLTSFQREFSMDLMVEWLIFFAITGLTYFVSIGIATLCFYNKEKEHWAESRLAVTLANNGFMAIPLMLALTGEKGVFLGSTNIIFLNILFWTYGTRILAPNSKIGVKQIVFNPGVIAVALGLLLFLSPWKLPEPVFQAVSSIGAMNTPLAMIVLGAFLAQTDLKQCIKSFALYKICAVKLLLIPCVTFILLSFLPLSQDSMVVAVICSVTPTATAVSMLAEIYHADFRFASGAVVFTTLISSVTMPIFLTIAKLLFGY